ncbi:barstar family protein [Streptomyces orinoci]|uniref:Barstar family protein n=1 Tax=Streptomyces orinoci TaxID=67339 RepID=A0ABV3K6P5_STRON|nr:barstar family protein [Streptomyces orinoci]
MEEHAVWDRAFPVKYLLVREDEDGEERFWGRCADVEGLFMDKVPPPREVLTLRGCAPAGPLRDALAPGGKATRQLGDVCVEIWDQERPVQWWNLVDTVVLAHRPSRADPALVDVIVGSGVEEDEGWSGALPPSPRFELSAQSARALGSCLGVDGLSGPRADPPVFPLELIGCEAAEPLLAVLRGPRKWAGDRVQLWALDGNGRVMYRHYAGLDITGARPSVLGGTLLDITLTDGGDNRPSLIARKVWETWYRGIPTAPNQWAPYGEQGRNEWLELTATGLSGRRPDRSGGVHHLDGRFVTDVPGLHCAMAEALLGPGKYFGREWNAFRDCLCGGFGVVPPFTLIWHDAHIARRVPADAVSGSGEGGLSYFEDIVRLLERHGATVVLA